MSQEPDVSDLHRPVTVPGYDEMLGADGELRDHWRYVVGSLRLLGRTELEERQRQATELVRRDGATHALDPAIDRSSGPLDVVPLLVPSEDWARIERGLLQRAELLDLVLEDVYGPQTLVRRGLLPVEVLHRHPGYLRPLRGEGGRETGHRLVHHSADVAREADGSFVVLGDRTRVPTGVGLALEHRVVVSSVLPSLFRDSHVHRLAHFFRGARQALLDLAPPGVGEPRIVVLAEGPDSPTYFEHSYLASYLGYPLVEAADLTVRRGRLWLRTLDGLQRVDVVIRGVDDEACDPLELDSGLGNGVPGLVEAARRGYVALANPLGAAVLESPALLPFLGRIAEHLLGTGLSLPSVESWWCGDERALAAVLDRLDELVFVPIDRRRGDAPVDGPMLSGERRDAFVAELRRDPGRWVAERLPTGGWAPTLAGDRLEARPVAIRTFSIARGGTFVAMPGGIGRVPAPGRDGPIRVPHPADPPAATRSKDVWVLASEPERQGTSLLAEPNAPAEAAEHAEPPTGVDAGALMLRTVVAGGTLPSRAAENLYWAARYAERAEQAVRWGRVVLGRMADAAEQGGDAPPEWLGALEGALGALLDDREADGTTVARLLDPDHGGLVTSLRSLATCAVSVRGLLSGDTWAVVDSLETEIDRIARFPPGGEAGARRVLDRLLGPLLALSGLTAESIVRDPVWTFLDAGRRIERGRAVVETCAATLGVSRDRESEAMVVESLLLANDSVITYRRRYRARVRCSAVLELLLADRTNPRALAYQLDRLVEHAGVVPTAPGAAPVDAEGRSEVVACAEAAVDLLDTVDLRAVADVEAGAARPELVAFLTTCGEALDALDDALGRFFIHVEPPRRLARTAGMGS